MESAIHTCGLEDIHLDKRIMQLPRIINGNAAKSRGQDTRVFAAMRSYHWVTAWGWSGGRRIRSHVHCHCRMANLRADIYLVNERRQPAGSIQSSRWHRDLLRTVSRDPEGGRTVLGASGRNRFFWIFICDGDMDMLLECEIWTSSPYTC